MNSFCFISFPFCFFLPYSLQVLGERLNYLFLSSDMIVITIFIILLIVFTKIVGCGVGAKLMGFPLTDSMRIGVGMMSRDEVSLIVTNLSVSSGLLDSRLFSTIVLMVSVTTLITPILLSLSYDRQS